MNWITDQLPPRWKHNHFSQVVLVIAETGDGCFQITPARVEHMSKGEWREVRYDHEGMGRKIVVRAWQPMVQFPERVPAAPDWQAIAKAKS